MDAVTEKRNALLESPTGTGKTLALLCAVLSWQRFNAAQNTSETNQHQPLNQTSNSPNKTDSKLKIKINNENFNELTLPDSNLNSVQSDDISRSTSTSSLSLPLPHASIDNEATQNLSDSDSDFEKPKKRPKISSFSSNSSSEQLSKPSNAAPNSNLPLNAAQSSYLAAENPIPPIPLKPKPIQIFYATRTHSQITQIVQELRKTSYQPKMTVLASRDKYCIHETVSAVKDKMTQCKNLNLDYGCRYKDLHLRLSTNAEFLPGGSNAVWDIEDFVATGKEVKCNFLFAFFSFRNTKTKEKSRFFFYQHQNKEEKSRFFFLINTKTKKK